MGLAHIYSILLRASTEPCLIRQPSGSLEKMNEELLLYRSTTVAVIRTLPFAFTEACSSFQPLERVDGGSKIIPPSQSDSLPNGITIDSTIAVAGSL